MKAYLKAQIPAQTALKVDLESYKQSFKSWFPDFYYRNLHIECYWFCQKYKNHFKTAEAKRPNKITFAGLILHKLVTQ